MSGASPTLLGLKDEEKQPCVEIEARQGGASPRHRHLGSHPMSTELWDVDVGGGEVKDGEQRGCLEIVGLCFLHLGWESAEWYESHHCLRRLW